MSIASWYIRHNFSKGDRKRDAGLTTPADVVRYDDISYGRDPKWNLLDVYRPKGVEGKLPVIISVHGGGWVYGTKEVYQFYCMSLAQRGFAVVNFNYRLSPEHRYPIQLQDTDAAFKWVLEHEEEYGFDTRNLFGVGDSAGGQLLSMYCAILADPSLGEKFHITVPEKQFSAVALNCGMYDQKTPEKKDSNNLLISDILGKGWTEEDLDTMRSAKVIKEGFPPAFVMSATGDFLREQVDILVPVLEKHHIDHEVKIYGSEDNVLGHVFHVNVKSDDARVCSDEECAFFRKYIV